MSDQESRFLAHYKALREHELALNDATAEFERAALQPLLLLNGGAAVAFVALLGAIWEKTNSRISLPLAIAAVGVWVVGLLLAAFAMIAGYLRQREFEIRARIEREIAEARLEIEDHPKANRDEMHDHWTRAKSYERWTYSSALASLVVFALGVAASLLAVIY